MWHRLSPGSTVAFLVCRRHIPGRRAARQGYQRLVGHPVVSRKNTQPVTDSVLSSNCQSRRFWGGYKTAEPLNTFSSATKAFRHSSRRPSTYLATHFYSSLSCRRHDHGSSTSFIRAQSETGYSQSLSRGIKRCLAFYMVTSSSSCISSTPHPPGHFRRPL